MDSSVIDMKHRNIKRKTEVVKIKTTDLCATCADIACEECIPELRRRQKKIRQKLGICARCGNKLWNGKCPNHNEEK